MPLPDGIADLPIPDLPVALHDDLAVNADATAAIIRHVRHAGLRTLLLGPNANAVSYSLVQYASLVEIARDAARDAPVIIGLGPELGRAIDQAPLVQRAGLQHVLLMPIHQPADTHGTADGIRHIADRLGHGVIVDLVRNNHLRPVTLRKLFDEGAVSALRYTVATLNPGDDSYLDSVIEIVGPERVISGIGEGAAMDHLGVRQMATITSGAAAIAPARVRDAVVAIRAGELAHARQLLAPVLAFERVCAMLGPIQVLHDAASFAGIADMGPQMPMVSRVKDKYRGEMEAATRALFGP